MLHIAFKRLLRRLVAVVYRPSGEIQSWVSSDDSEMMVLLMPRKW